MRVARYLKPGKKDVGYYSAQFLTRMPAPEGRVILHNPESNVMFDGTIELFNTLIQHRYFRIVPDRLLVLK